MLLLELGVRIRIRVMVMVRVIETPGNEKVRKLR